MFGRIRSVIKATTLEVVSEPLFFLLTSAAVGVLTVASLLHVHQFGEPSRMARDAGLSSVLIFGIVFAVFAAIRAFRREIESGTLQMALSRPLSRHAFFLSKAAGVFFGYILFFVIVFSSSVTTAVGAEVAAMNSRLAAARECGASHGNALAETLWGVSLAVDVAVIVVPLIAGAFLNRFFRFRFTATAFVTALIVSVAGCAFNLAAAHWLFGGKAAGLFDMAYRLLSAGVLLAIPAAVFLSLASALSIRLKDNVASSVSAVAFALFVPALGNYYQTQALHAGGELPWSYVGAAFVAALPFIAAFLFAGAFLLGSGDVE